MAVSNVCFLLLICVVVLASRPLQNSSSPAGFSALPVASLSAKSLLPENDEFPSTLEKPPLSSTSPPSELPAPRTIKILTRPSSSSPRHGPELPQQASQLSSQSQPAMHQQPTPISKSHSAPLILHTDPSPRPPRIPGFGLYTGPEQSSYSSGSVYEQQAYQQSLSSLSRYRGINIQPGIHARQSYKGREYRPKNGGRRSSFFSPKCFSSSPHPVILPPTYFLSPGQGVEFFTKSTARDAQVIASEKSVVSKHIAAPASSTDVLSPLAKEDVLRLASLLDKRESPVVTESQGVPPLKHTFGSKPASYNAGYFGATPAVPLAHTRYYIVPRRNYHYHQLFTPVAVFSPATAKFKNEKALSKADWTRTIRNIYLSSFRYIPNIRARHLEVSMQVDRHALERRMQLFFPKGQLRIVFVPDDAEKLGAAYPLFQPAPPNTPLFHYTRAIGDTGKPENAAFVLPHESCVVLHRFAVNAEAPEAMQPLLLVFIFHSSRSAVRLAVYEHFVGLEKEARRLWLMDNRIGGTNPHGFTSLLETYPAPLGVLLSALRAALPGHVDEAWRAYEARARKFFPNVYLRTIEPSKHQSVRMTECFLEPFASVHYPGSLLYSHGTSVSAIRNGNIKTIHSISHNNEAAISVYSDPIASWIRSGIFPSHFASLALPRRGRTRNDYKDWRLDELRLFIEREDSEWSADFNEDTSLLSIVHFRRVSKMLNAMNRCNEWVDQVRRVFGDYIAFHNLQQQQQQQEQSNSSSQSTDKLDRPSGKPMVDDKPLKDASSTAYTAIKTRIYDFDVAVASFKRTHSNLPSVIGIQEAADKRLAYLRAARPLRKSFIGIFEKMDELYEGGLSVAGQEYFGATYLSVAFYDRDVVAGALAARHGAASLLHTLPKVRAGAAIARLLQFRWQQTAIDEAADQFLFTPTLSDYEQHTRLSMSGEGEVDAIYKLAPDTRPLLRRGVCDIPEGAQRKSKDLHHVEFEDRCGDAFFADKDHRSDNRAYCTDDYDDEGGRRGGRSEAFLDGHGHKKDDFPCPASTTDENPSSSSSSNNEHNIRGDDSPSPPSSPLSAKDDKQLSTKPKQPKEEMHPKAKAIVNAASASLKIAQSDWSRLTAANASPLLGMMPAVAEAWWYKLYSDLCRSFAVPELSGDIDDYLGRYADSLRSSSKGSVGIEWGTLKVAEGGGTLTALFPPYANRSLSSQAVAASLQAAQRYSLHYVSAGTPMATVVPFKFSKSKSSISRNKKKTPYALDFDVLAWPLPKTVALLHGNASDTASAGRKGGSGGKKANRRVKVKSKVKLVQWVRVVVAADPASVSSLSSSSSPSLSSPSS